MSEIDFDSQVSSEDEAASGDKLVPVGEAIRYRRRAQSAEKEAAELRQQLKVSQTDNERLVSRVDEMNTEQELVSLLTAGGVTDLEAAVLIARTRMAGTDNDAKSIVEQLRKEKGYLFEQPDESVTASLTSGVKERSGGSRGVLERAAQRAVNNGSRTAVQEYMKVRRKFI